MVQAHNLTDDERVNIEALIKSFDDHGCGFGLDLQAQVALRLLLDKLAEANKAINEFEAQYGG